MAISAVDALAALRTLNEAIAAKPSVVPEDFLTVDQWAEAWEIPRHTAYHKIKAGIAAKVFEVEKFRIATLNGDGRVIPVPHYRLVPVSRKAKGRGK